MVKFLIISLVFSISAHGRNVTFKPNSYNMIAEGCCFLDWGNSGWFDPASEFPNVSLYSIKLDKNV